MCSKFKNVLKIQQTQAYLQPIHAYTNTANRNLKKGKKKAKHTHTQAIKKKSKIF